MSKFSVENGNRMASLLTKREIMAMAAMKGLASLGEDEMVRDRIAETAVRLADDLLTELTEERP